MSLVSDAVGLIYEDRLKDQFPELKRTQRLNHPDFTAGTFYVEAKAGYRDYGVRFKRYQVEEFQKLDKPTIYALGFHAFPRLMQFKGRKNKRRLVQTMMRLLTFPEEYVISDQVVQTVWNQERRTSSKGFEYCTAKRRFFEQMIRGGLIVRNGAEHDTHEYYGINPDDFVLQLPTPHTFGTLLHKVKDAEVLAFLKRHRKS